MIALTMARRRACMGAGILSAMLWLTACGSDEAAPAPVVVPPPAPPAVDAGNENPYPGYDSAIYANTARWLCHPALSGQDNVCNADLRTTAVDADGKATPLPFQAATDAAIDCFYVYPTASADAAYNSDFRAGPQEIQTTIMQAARYGQTCRVFAPLYRQRTLTLLAVNVVAGRALPFELGPNSGEVAYADVLDAFRHYIAHENQGRGVLLIGHSQGASLLRRLIAEEIEPQPTLHARLVAAHLLGSTVAVPRGADVGGSFARTPACRHAEQHGCVVSYASYREGDPQLEAPRFGVTGDPATQALCIHPAALAGGAAPLAAQLPFRLPPVFQLLLIPRGSGGPYADRAANRALDTPFFAVPGQLTGECVVDDATGASYLQVRIAVDPDDPRADDYPGEFFGGTGWGLHLADVSLAQDDLVALAAAQAQAWRSSRSP